MADGILPSPVVRQRISTAICTARDFCPWIRPAWSIIAAAAVVSLYRFAMFLLPPVILLRRRVSLFMCHEFNTGRCPAVLPPQAVTRGSLSNASGPNSRPSMLGMGRIEAASLAYERSVLATNTAAARGRIIICYSSTDWSFPLVRGSDSRRLPSASATLGGASTACKGFERQLDEI